MLTVMEIIRIHTCTYKNRCKNLVVSQHALRAPRREAKQLWKFKFSLPDMIFLINLIYTIRDKLLLIEVSFEFE